MITAFKHFFAVALAVATFPVSAKAEGQDTCPVPFFRTAPAVIELAFLREHYREIRITRDANGYRSLRHRIIEPTNAMSTSSTTYWNSFSWDYQLVDQRYWDPKRKKALRNSNGEIITVPLLEIGYVSLHLHDVYFFAPGRTQGLSHGLRVDVSYDEFGSIVEATYNCGVYNVANEVSYLASQYEQLPYYSNTTLGVTGDRAPHWLCNKSRTVATYNLSCKAPKKTLAFTPTFGLSRELLTHTFAKIELLRQQIIFETSHKRAQQAFKQMTKELAAIRKFVRIEDLDILNGVLHFAKLGQARGGSLGHMKVLAMQMQQAVLRMHF